MWWKYHKLINRLRARLSYWFSSWFPTTFSTLLAWNYPWGLDKCLEWRQVKRNWARLDGDILYDFSVCFLLLSSAASHIHIIIFGVSSRSNTGAGNYPGRKLVGKPHSILLYIHRLLYGTQNKPVNSGSWWFQGTMPVSLLDLEVWPLSLADIPPHLKRT